MLKSFFFLLIFFNCVTPVFSQIKIIHKPSKTLNIGIAGTEPFVFAESNTGIAIETWEKIAQIRSWDYGYTPFQNVDDALQALNKGKVDIVVGPISSSRV